MLRWSLVGNRFSKEASRFPFLQNPNHGVLFKNPSPPLSPHRDYHFYKIPIMGVLFQKPFSIPSTHIRCNDSVLAYITLWKLTTLNTLGEGMLGQWPKKWSFLIKSPCRKCFVHRLLENHGKPFSEEASWFPFLQNPNHGGTVPKTLSIP